ncbi:ribosome biogenesis protein Rlp7p [[Candida] jaroonii]|uniref:Ribosome biogenesis protein Rlp7p n=1 Tax=[Candida] jaroonii TaxID=467808 RepID=A0ACA9Y5P5_9ASCO|nr:ribosome biogenesis protein Rlp7p [[Candida] jaroonii]
MAILNSNPEILLKKRKDRDLKRLQKQEQAKERDAARAKAAKTKAKKFIRAETLISNYKTKELEAKRVKNITKFEASNAEEYVEPKLLFLIRIPNHKKGVKIPPKAQKILNLLKLHKINSGVFVVLNENVLQLLKLISPYIVCGKPSLISIRKLFQKRANVKINDEIVKLDNNQLVEDEFEEEGLICIEDLIQELISLSSNIKRINQWLMPFTLNLPVNGFGPQNKLAKLKYNVENKRGISLAGNVELSEVDIDKVIDEQN